MAISSPKHQVWTTYGTVVGSDSPRLSRSINVRASNPAAPRCLVCSSSFDRPGSGSSGSSIFRSRL